VPGNTIQIVQAWQVEQVSRLACHVITLARSGPVMLRWSILVRACVQLAKK
jgi:hypothetical protein